MIQLGIALVGRLCHRSRHVVVRLRLRMQNIRSLSFAQATLMHVVMLMCTGQTHCGCRHVVFHLCLDMRQIWTLAIMQATLMHIVMFMCMSQPHHGCRHMVVHL